VPLTRRQDGPERLVLHSAKGRLPENPGAFPDRVKKRPESGHAFSERIEARDRAAFRHAESPILILLETR